MKKLNKGIRTGAKQMGLYLIVGAVATLVEWTVFYLLVQYAEIRYFIATPIAFIFSTYANWIIGRRLLFHPTQNIKKELAKIYLTSAFGLLWNLLIMWLAVDGFGLAPMLSKIMATGIVFLWNFAIRKFLIYGI